MKRLRKVICVDNTSSESKLIAEEREYYLDISSIMGDSDGDWSGLIYSAEEISKDNLIGRYYLRHFKSYGR